MTCELRSVEGPQKTEYDFFTSPRGEAIVETVYSGFNNGRNFLDFSVQGSTLVIGFDNTKYDLSAAPRITRTFEHCVTPGYPSGDDKPLCENITETCTLN